MPFPAQDLPLDGAFTDRACTAAEKAATAPLAGHGSTTGTEGAAHQGTSRAEAVASPGTCLAPEPQLFTSSFNDAHGDNGRVGILHIVLGELPGIAHLFVRQEVLHQSLLQQQIPHVFLIRQNILHR